MRHPGLPIRTAGFGSWEDAEELRKWSFLRRTPQQRLDWLVDALTIAFLAKRAGLAKTAGGVGLAPPDECGPQDERVPTDECRPQVGRRPKGGP
jgi:hypothetical protein